jgi:hypothetical protein
LPDAQCNVQTHGATQRAAAHSRRPTGCATLRPFAPPSQSTVGPRLTRPMRMYILRQAELKPAASPSHSALLAAPARRWVIVPCDGSTRSKAPPIATQRLSPEGRSGTAVQR